MAKVKQPLLSFDARRKLGDDIVFKRQGRTAIVETRPIPKDARSVGQLSWRHMFQKVVAMWQALSAAEKEVWESLARPQHMTGYAWFVSQALRPNPGIYLPLQGGIMTGEIDMGADKIINLLDPTNPQDAVTLAYYLANLPDPGEGATKEFFIPATGRHTLFSISGHIGWLVSAIDAGERAHTEFYIPDDFTSITEAVVALISRATATHRLNITSNYGAVGASSSTHTESLVDVDTAMAINVIYEIDVSGILTALAVGDYVGIYAYGDAVNTPNVVVLGVRFKYS